MQVGNAIDDGHCTGSFERGRIELSDGALESSSLSMTAPEKSATFSALCAGIIPKKRMTRPDGPVAIDRAPQLQPERGWQAYGNHVGPWQRADNMTETGRARHGERVLGAARAFASAQPEPSPKVKARKRQWLPRRARVRASRSANLGVPY
jgi:hypothetical protein